MYHGIVLMFVLTNMSKFCVLLLGTLIFMTYLFKFKHHGSIVCFSRVKLVSPLENGDFCSSITLFLFYGYMCWYSRFRKLLLLLSCHELFSFMIYGYRIWLSLIAYWCRFFILVCYLCRPFFYACVIGVLPCVKMVF